MQLAQSRQRLAAERNRLKQDWRSEVETNLMLRTTNCQLQTRLSQLEDRVQKLEAQSAQFAAAQLLADREAVAASRAAAAASASASAASASASAESASTASASAASEEIKASPVSAVSSSESYSSRASPGLQHSAGSAGSKGAQQVEDWFSAQFSPNTIGTPRSDDSVSRSAALFATPPRVPEPEPAVEHFSPLQAHDLSIVPPYGYAGRTRRRAALAASTNLVEPGLHSKMTQGMRKRNQLPARLGAYDDTWNSDAASYMAHKEA